MLKRNLIIAVIFISVLFAVRTSAQDATIQAFSNNAPITINDNGNASVYPSTINVSGVSAFTRMTVRLQGFSHTFPDDVDIILVGPQGQRAILMSDAGGNLPVTNQFYIFAQTTTTPIPDATALTTNNFRPANYQNIGGNLVDTFPAPGPGALTDAPADLFVFNGTNPNGIWSLYIVDDVGGDVGSIALGWDMVFTVPQVFTVTNTNDSGGGSLRDAITLAQNGDLINFSSLFNTPQTINLLTALPDINRSITIQGTGANLLTVRRDFNAAANFRIFNNNQLVANGVAISGMTITGGNVSGGDGGGILFFSHLTLTNVHVTGNTAGNGGGVSLGFADGVFTNCTFSNNSSTNAAGRGGGIFYQGSGGRTLRLVSSTVSGNRAAGEGGGIQNISNDGSTSRLEITNSTIANNTAVNAGGIRTFTQTTAGSTATTTLRNTIIANNSPNNLAVLASGGIGAATFQTLGFNLSDNFNGVFTPIPGSDITSATPRLAPLALYGGRTPTHALLHLSPAINAGDASGATTDQRGVDRVTGTSADIGAVEMRPVVVNNVSNTGPFSLRNVVAATNSGGDMDDILFDNTVFNSPQTIILTTGELSISNPVNIIAPGANLVTISGGNNSRVFSIGSGITATLSGMTITGGNANGDGGGILNNGNLTLTNAVVTGNQTGGFDNGGGIYNNGTLSVFNSTISGNTSGLGGGILNDGSGVTTLTNSTISGNTANASAGTSGGIDNNGSLTVIHSTISDNRAPNGNNSGGGILSLGNTIITNSTITNNSVAGAGSASGVFRFGGTVNIRNSIIAGNVGNATQPDVSAFDSTGITSNGFNLIGNRGTVTFNQTGDQFGTGSSPLAPRLAPLALNGGTTPTHALFAGSPALDGGQSSGATSDQRGSQRPFDLPDTNVSDGADIGAFEAQTAPSGAPTVFISDVSLNEGNTGTTNFTFTVSLSAASGSSVTVAYQTADGTATAPTDYTGVPLPTTLTFNGGETSKTVTILVNGDTTIEANESFFVNLISASGATIADNQGLGTIQNDDGACSYNLSPASPQTIPATSSNLNVSVTTSAGCAWTATTSTAFITINSGSSGNGNGTVNMTFAANTGAARSGSLTIAGQTYTINQAAGSVVSIRAPFDYDGDNKTDISIFRPAPGEWWINSSINNSTIAFQFGATTDKLVPADYTGDGKTDVAFWRPSNGQWFVLRSEDSTFFAFPFGTTGDVPVPADYDGDGKADAAVFRESSLTWFIQKSSGGTDFIGFGATGDKPTVADYDGDRKADIAIIRPNGATGTEWWIRQSSNASVFALQFGTPTDKAMQGDFTGDGKADVAFWRPSNGFWFILRSEDLTFFAFPFGANGDTPVAGDYDGDGKFDAGVYRPSNFTWFIQRSTAGTLIQQFGIAADIPTPSAFVP